MRDVSETALQLYDYIVGRIGAGLSPSVREICDDLGFRSTSTAHRYIDELWRAGYIEKVPGQRRTISLPSGGARMVPIIGVAAAGAPILAVQEIEGYLPVSPGDTSGEMFAIRIKGDSMIGAGILDGDLVLFRRTAAADNGDIVLALVGDEATVKRFFKEDGHFRLQPENDRLQPIIVSEVAVLGRADMVVRKL